MSSPEFRELYPNDLALLNRSGTCVIELVPHTPTETANVALSYALILISSEFEKITKLFNDISEKEFNRYSGRIYSFLDPVEDIIFKYNDRLQVGPFLQCVLGDDLDTAEDSNPESESA